MMSLKYAYAWLQKLKLFAESWELGKKMTTRKDNDDCNLFDCVSFQVLQLVRLGVFTSDVDF